MITAGLQRSWVRGTSPRMTVLKDGDQGGSARLAGVAGRHVLVAVAFVEGHLRERAERAGDVGLGLGGQKGIRRPARLGPVVDGAQQVDLTGARTAAAVID